MSLIQEQIAEHGRRYAVPVDRVLREELQKLALRYLSEHGFFSGGVFQGGTAIRLFYQGSRFSEDLDFVFREKGHHLLERLDALLGGLAAFVRREVPFAEDVLVDARKAKGVMHRHRLRLAAPGLDVRMRIHLEFANIPSHRPGVRLLRVAPLDVPVVVEDETEILADKLVALGLREYLKGRDLWDLDFLTRERGVPLPDADLLARKSRDYGHEPAALARRLAGRVADLEREGVSTVESELRRFLPPRLRQALEHAYPDLVRRVVANVRTAASGLEASS